MYLLMAWLCLQILRLIFCKYLLCLRNDEDTVVGKGEILSLTNIILCRYNTDRSDIISLKSSEITPNADFTIAD